MSEAYAGDQVLTQPEEGDLDQLLALYGHSVVSRHGSSRSAVPPRPTNSNFTARKRAERLWLDENGPRYRANDTNNARHAFREFPDEAPTCGSASVGNRNWKRGRIRDDRAPTVEISVSDVVTATGHMVVAIAVDRMSGGIVGTKVRRLRSRSGFRR